MSLQIHRLIQTDAALCHLLQFGCCPAASVVFHADMDVGGIGVNVTKHLFLCPLAGVVQQVAEQFQHIFAVAEAGNLREDIEGDATRGFVVDACQHVHQHREFLARVETLGGVALPCHAGAFEFAFGKLADALSL